MTDLFTLILERVFEIAAAFAVMAASLKYIHMLQLESYQGRMYMKWLSKRIVKELAQFLLAGLMALTLKVCYVFFAAGNELVSKICYTGADALYVFLLVLFALPDKKSPKPKKPLAYTNRVVRMSVMLVVLAFLFSAGFFVPTYYTGQLTWIQYLLPLIIRYLPGATVPLFVMLAYLVMYPVEELIKLWYYNDAKKKLKKHEGLIRIGITGSYGKTSTKYALAAILKKKYNVLFTQGSYNTAMGVTRVIREQLKEEHEVFIAEMGARYKGDIRQLCRLVEPQYGIVTSVGKQHLETFGSIDAIIETKSELQNGLTEDGCCFFNGQNEYCLEMFEAASCEKYLFGTDGTYLNASDVTVSSEGSAFMLITEDGESIACTTKLLGRHNIQNITAAAALAYRMGLTLDEIAEGIAEIEPVEHRMQLIPGSVTVIDDAFNSNPVGSKEALDTLKLFSGRHIVVTPGMVELGAEEDDLNREFGVHMAKCADIAILVGGAHVEPIAQGLLMAGFDEACIVRAATLEEATAKLPPYTEPGCVVLFENDLPDNYNE